MTGLRFMMATRFLSASRVCRVTSSALVAPKAHGFAHKRHPPRIQYASAIALLIHSHPYKRPPHSNGPRATWLFLFDAGEVVPFKRQAVPPSHSPGGTSGSEEKLYANFINEASL